MGAKLKNVYWNPPDKPVYLFNQFKFYGKKAIFIGKMGKKKFTANFVGKKPIILFNNWKAILAL